MEGLKLIEKGTVDSIPKANKNENLHLLEDFKAVVKNLTENALNVLNKMGANEMSKSEPNAELIEDYYLLFHYLDFLKRFVSSKS
jgi:hypothetical protein